MFWQDYKKKALEKVRSGSSNGVVVAGDGRRDSMGHSAKYCAYTIFCCNVPMIIDFNIVQVNLILHIKIKIITLNICFQKVFSGCLVSTSFL